MNQTDRELARAARRSAEAFEKEFLKNNKALNPTEMAKKFEFYLKLDPNVSAGSGSSSLGSISSVTSNLGSGFEKMLGAGESSGYFPEESKLSEKLGDFVKNLGLITQPLELGKKLLGSVIDETLFFYKQQSELVRTINREAGLTGDFAAAVREELTMTNPELLRLGISFQSLANSAKSVVSDSGRFLALNRDTWKETGAAASAYVGSLEETVAMFPQFEKVGIGAGDVSKQIEMVGKRSIELGLQSQKTTKDLSVNLSKLNEYGFKNGTQGLAEMVRKSTELRYNMGEVFKIAEKVFEPEGAIDLAANLQAIGGAIGDFNDPLKLMYMATNNVEGLGTALEGVAGSLATYNQEQNRFEITGVNLRKARALAKELGMEYGELANMAVASAERSSAAADLMATGLSLDEDQKRFITNIATMKDGKMQIELQSDKLKTFFEADTIALEDLSQKQVEQLIGFQNEFKKLDKEEIVQKQATDIENIGRNIQFLTAVARERLVRESKDILGTIVKKLGYDPETVYKDINEKLNKGIVDLGNTIKSKPDLNKENNRSKSEIKPTTKLTEENMKSSIDPLKAMFEATQSVINKETQPKKLDISLNYNSPNMLDNLSRGLFRSPEFIDTIKNGIIDDKSYV